MLSKEQVAIANPPTAAEPRSTLEDVYQRLRSLIIRAELPPGRAISQVQLAKKFGVSRSPLREALRLLEREGLVRSEHNRRVAVAAMSVEDMEELYALRISVEPLALQMSVPGLTHNDIFQLRKMLDEMDAFLDSEQVNEWEELHKVFHRKLICRAGERSLRLCNDLMDHAERYRRMFIAQSPQGWATSAKEHRTLVELAAQGKAQAAAHKLARHYARTSLSVLTIEAPEYEPARIRMALRRILADEDAVLN